MDKNRNLKIKMNSLVISLEMDVNLNINCLLHRKCIFSDTLIEHILTVDKFPSTLIYMCSNRMGKRT